MADNPRNPTSEDYPTDRKVVEIMDAAGGASEAEVVSCLKYLYNERGLRPNTKNGPRAFAWFPTVVQDYFQQQRSREESANPIGYHEWEERNATKDARMTDEEICQQSAAFDPTG